VALDMLVSPSHGSTYRDAIRTARGASLLVFSLVMMGIGVWSAIFLSRRRIKDQFVARPIAAGANVP
jgi:hypothetical protein